jgi:hypothetical protein
MTHLRHWMAILLCVALALTGTALAQQFNIGLGDDLRLEGILDPAPDAPRLGMLVIRAADSQRTLAVAAAQTSFEEGMVIFQPVAQYAWNVQLVGDESVLRAFRTAAPRSHVRILGLFQPAARRFLVSEIEVRANGA